MAFFWACVAHLLAVISNIWDHAHCRLHRRLGGGPFSFFVVLTA